MQTIFMRIQRALLLVMICGTLLITNQYQNHALAAPAKAPRSNDLIHRAQIEIQTCNRDDAGTDDTIGVRLNSRNNTWLYYSHGNLKRNKSYVYDLMLERVQNIEGISFIEIHKGGTDGIALEKFTLLVNNKRIYSKEFGSSCHWLDNDNGHQRTYTISYDQLRAHPWWQNYQQPALPTLIRRAEIQSRIESIVGNALKTIDPPWPVKSAKWDHSNAVSISRKGAQKLAVRVDVEARVDALVGTVGKSIDVRFDIDLKCSNGRITIASTRPKATVLSKSITISDRITVNMELGAASCPTIQVSNNGDVHLVYPHKETGDGLHFRNETGETLWLALGYKDSSSGEWVAKGWYKMIPGQSQTFGTGDLTQKTYYFYAEGGSFTWEGDYSFWIHPSDPFGPIPVKLSASTAKNHGYKRQGFRKVDIGNNSSYTYRLFVN